MFALICMCGGLGAVTRFVLNTSIQRWWNRAFPLSTFIINVLATFFAGVAAAAYFYQTADHSSYLLFVTGFLGGFSTFSTAINEMVSLARSGKYAAAAVYFMMTVLVPVVCVVLVGADRAGAVARLRWSGSQNSQIQKRCCWKIGGSVFVSASFESVVLYTIRRTVIL